MSRTRPNGDELAGDAVARALVAKNNPVIVVVAAEGQARGRAKALVVLLRARGFEQAVR